MTERDAAAYELIFEASSRPMWLVDHETRRFIAVNQAVVALYGWSREEFLAMSLDDIRSPEEVPELDRALASTPTTGTFRRAGWHKTKAGAEIEVDLEITRVMFRGRLSSIVVLTNITSVDDVRRRFGLLVEHSNEGISIIDDQGVLRYMSPGGERLLGLERGEQIGKLASALTHPDDVARMGRTAPGETRSFVTRVRRKDGSWRWMESTTTNLLRDPDVRAIVANFRDVTERIETHRRLEFLLSATSSVTYTSKARDDFATTYVSPNVREVLGWEPSQLVGQHGFWLGNIHPDDRPSIEQALAMLFEVGSHQFEYRFRARDDGWRWIHDQARLVRDESGHPIEIVGCMLDISARRHAEELLRVSEANFRTLIERSPFCVFVHSAGLFRYVNPAAIALLGYDSAGELLGRRVLDLVHAEDRDAVQSRMRHTQRHGGGAAGEARMLRRDGSIVVVEAEGLLLDFDGEPSNVVLCRDITERSELYARMAVADRLLSVGTLAAGIAHEINNPLAYVSSNLEVLARELPALRDGNRSLSPADLETLLGDTREGTERVGAIVRGLRALSRSDDASIGPIDVAGVLASSIKMAHNEIRHRARVVERIAPELPPVEGNASRLGQVFLNVLVNAAQAIPEGRADANEIRVQAFADADGRRVVIDIEDTGGGIPRGVIGRIFDPFFTTKPIGHGMGLGLSISHEIVRSFGGTMTVDSTVGVGSTFRVSLPAAPARTSPPSPVVAPRPSVPARVLVIDDEAAVGRSIALLLAPDYEVTPVTRAQEALARLAAGERFEAIVCDVMMPEMSGIDFFDQLTRAAPELVDRLVFLTGGAFTQQARDFLASASRPQLGKPFSERDLRRVIAEVAR
jgi:two-component system cell cycle sensor histidine kinase/response regulator CckA